MKYSLLITKDVQGIQPTSPTASKPVTISTNCFITDLLTDTNVQASDIKTLIKNQLHLVNVKSEELCLRGATVSIPDSTVVTNDRLDYYVTV
jgi:hypothetical protein